MKLKIAAFLLILSVLLLPILASCAGGSDNDGDVSSSAQESTTANGSGSVDFGEDEPYKIVYVYSYNVGIDGETVRTNEGFCEAQIVTNPMYDKPFTVTVPDKSPYGDTVNELVCYEPFVDYSNLPRIIFADQLEPVFEDIEEKYDDFYATKFKSYYVPYDLEKATNQSGKDRIINMYPMAQIAPIYVLDPTASSYSLERLSEMLTEVGYTAQKYYADVENMNSRIEKSGKQINKISYHLGDNIVKVELPSTIEKIDAYAFANCKKLEEINIPESVKYIYLATFENCKSLEEISLPESVMYISQEAFSGCSALKKITFEGEIKFIGKKAFDGCDALNYTKYEGGMYLSLGDNPYAILVRPESADITSITVHENTEMILPDFALIKTKTLDDKVEADTYIEQIVFANTENRVVYRDEYSVNGDRGEEILAADLENMPNMSEAFGSEHKYKEFASYLWVHKTGK